MTSAHQHSLGTSAERRATLGGRALERGEDDLAFWREASDEQRGPVLSELLLFVSAVG